MVASVHKKHSRPLHTYSIVARDPKSGEMGVAVQSHWFSVGSIVSWGEAGVGVVATQSFTNPEFGPRGLGLMKSGYSAKESLEKLIGADKGRDRRQVALLNPSSVAAYTGERCIPEAGHLVGETFSVHANMMLNDSVWSSMFSSFERSKGLLAERLVSALEAGERAGGDIRGRQSAALVVVKGESSGRVWEDRLVDLRVEDSSDPLTELRRLLNIHRAYEYMSGGDIALERGDMKSALKHYSSAKRMFPENDEMVFWQAVGLANNGEVDQAISILRSVFERNSNWRILSRRLVQMKMLKPGMDEV